MGVDRAFWRDRRVFLSGHTGFKGSWLSAWLQRMGADLTGFALDPDSTPNHFTLAQIGQGMQDVRGDLCQTDQLREAVQVSRAEVVIHMAAQSLVRTSYADPAGTFATNVQGTVNLLEAARGAPSVRVLLVVTSDKVYRNDERGRAFTEGDALGGGDPYSASKACQELVVAAYREAVMGAETALATARSGNVIGGGDWSEDRLIPDAVRAFGGGQVLQVRRPDAVRPWQHVLDALSGYLLLAQRMWNSGQDCARPWNFAPQTDSMRPVSEVVSQFADFWGDGASWTSAGGEHPHEAGLLRLDGRQARSELGWRNMLGLAESLQWTFDWYRHWQRNADMAEITAAQICRYERLREQSA